jgi:hypothetical protein
LDAKRDQAGSIAAVKSDNLQEMSIDALVERFEAITLAQDHAVLAGETAKLNRLIRQMEVVKGELKRRPGDQLRALMPLYGHPNPQVRLKAMRATLALAPEEARRQLQKLAASGEQPQSGEAGMAIYYLDTGMINPT